MRLWLLSVPNKDSEEGFRANGGYVSIHDDGTHVERRLVIEDDSGNCVTLYNEQIGKLFDYIKPALHG